MLYLRLGEVRRSTSFSPNNKASTHRLVHPPGFRARNWERTPMYMLVPMARATMSSHSFDLCLRVRSGGDQVQSGIANFQSSWHQTTQPLRTRLSTCKWRTPTGSLRSLVGNIPGVITVSAGCGKDVQVSFSTNLQWRLEKPVLKNTSRADHGRCRPLLPRFSITASMWSAAATRTIKILVDTAAPSRTKHAVFETAQFVHGIGSG